jgi:cytochrome c
MRLTGCLAIAASLLLPACRAEPPAAGGDRDNGRLLLRQFGCGACHRIPGVAAAEGNVGPPLAGIARRVYIAGVLPNSPRNMARFIMDPQQVDPRTAMPDLQVTEPHARDMVAYLQGLE